LAYRFFGQRFRLAALLLCLALPEVTLLGFFSAGAVLAWPAAQPSQADAIVVLGGDGTNGRYARGLELLQAGYSGQLVLIEPNAADRKHVLAKVPGVLIWDDVVPGNSWGEAKVTRARMLANGWRTALVVSDPPHLLRVAYAWSSNFWGSGLSYTLIATHPPWWSAWRWWAHPQSASFVENEVLKLGYYVVRYRFGLF
jgi:uncharacterized SAM-binding protein YcdF (DUF218 family)